VSANKYQHFIIGGTIKAATSSLFSYISAHPQVCGSRVKETWFFSTQYSGDPEQDFNKYASYFSPTVENTVLFEASPEYLTYKENVAPRIKQLLPDAKLLFVLRNPVDRLYSHFNFARGQLQLPGDLNFEKFVEFCEHFNNGQTSAAESGIALKHLRALEMGNYSRYLVNFYNEFETDRIKVMFYDEFASNPLVKLAEIAEFIGVSPTFFEGFTMNRANVTFSSRLKFLHLIALLFNRLLEPQLRRYPSLKHSLVKLYKTFNQDKRGFVAMQEETRKKLNDYYAPGNAEIKQMLAGQNLPFWIT
jgi:hypothetical protein